MLEHSKNTYFFIVKDFLLFFLIFLLSIILIDGLEHGIFVALNTLLLLKLYRSSKTFTILLYFIMSITMFCLPVLFHSHNEFFSAPVANDYNYIDALIYIFIFNTVLYASYHFFCNNIFRQPISIFRSVEVNKRQAILGSVFLMALSLVAEFYLSYIGKTAGVHGVITSFNEIANLLTPLKVASILLIGFYIKQRSSKDVFIYILYLLFIILSIGLAIKSGSRSEPIIVLFALVYIHIETIKRHKIFFGILLLLLTPILTLMFPVLMIYRNNISMGLINVYMGVVDGSLLPAYWEKYSFISVFGDIILDRMNLVRVIQIVLGSGIENSGYHSDYLQNITNNIPRILWEGKPHAGIDGNSLGHELGILHPTDKRTSIGLTVIGESFYQLKYYGPLIAVVQGAIFSFFDKKLTPINVGAFILYFIMVTSIVTMGSYLYVIPKIIKIFVIYLFVIFFMGLLKVKLRFG
jgi:hypothetical protein